MVAVVKMKSNILGNQKSPSRKTQCHQNKQNKPQTKRKRETKSGQVIKYVKKTPGKTSFFLPKGYHLTAKAQGVLSSSVKRLCKMISSKADRLRKERKQSTVSQKILVTALKHCFEKRNISHSLVPGAKKVKGKKQPSVDVAKKTERQTTPRQTVPKQLCKPPAIPVCNECS